MRTSSSETRNSSPGFRPSASRTDLGRVIRPPGRQGDCHPFLIVPRKAPSGPDRTNRAKLHERYQDGRASLPWEMPGSGAYHGAAHARQLFAGRD